MAPRTLAAVPFVLLLAASACGDGSASPPPSPPRDAPAPAPAKAPSTASAPGTPAREASAEPGARAPDARLVWTAPVATPPPCGNQRHVFDFDPDARGYDDKSAFWMMWAAMRSFTSEAPATRDELAQAGFARYASFDDPKTGLQAYVAGGERAVIVAFRGSTELRDWIADFDFPQVEGAPLGVAGRVHRGFATALAGTFSAIEAEVRRASARGERVWLTGHSLGGAMATLTATRLARAGAPVAALYTFGAPRAGDRAFATDAWAALSGRAFRFVNERDLVPRLPPSGAAADGAARVAQLDFAERATARLLRDLDYWHVGALFAFDPAARLSAFPAMTEDDDRAYWEELGGRAANGRILNLVTDNLEQGARHNEATYLCRMRELYLAASEGERARR